MAQGTQLIRRRYLAATIIDAVGSGLWMPFVLLFFVHGQGMNLAAAGGALSSGAVLGLAAGPLYGSLLDRVGPVAVLLMSNIMRLAAFACYPQVSSLWQVALVSAVVTGGDRLFWTANTPVLVAVTTGRDTERMLGWQTIARCVGAGLGAGVAALIPNLSDPTTYHLLAYANGATFGVAAVLVAGLKVPRTRPQDAPNGSWRAVLRDGAYTRFCAGHAFFTLASVGKFSILPILVLDILHGPQWLPGVAISLGALVIVLVQAPVIRLASRWSRAAGLVAAAAVFAGSFAAMIPVTVLPSGAAVAVILAVSITFAFAEALFAPLATAAAAQAAPAHAPGRASALFQLSWAVSTVAGPALLTGLLSLGSPVLWAVLTLTSAAGGVVVLALRRAMAPGVLAG